MRLTLQDFRNVLGRQNDGNVIFADTGHTSIKKVNYGWHGHLITHEKTPSDPTVNLQIRQALMSALTNSDEGRVLSEDTLRNIREELGLDDDPHVADETLLKHRPLERHDIKRLFDLVDAEAGNGKLIDRQTDIAKAKGLFHQKIDEAARQLFIKAPALRSQYGMIEALGLEPGKMFHGFPAADVAKLVMTAFPRLQAQIYAAATDLLLTQTNADMELLVDNSDLFWSEKVSSRLAEDALLEMMTAYGSHREPQTELERVYAPIPSEQRTVNLDDQDAREHFASKLADLDAKIDALFGKGGYDVGGSVTDSLSFRNMADAIKSGLRKQLNTFLTENQNNLESADAKFVELTVPIGSLDKTVTDALAGEDPLGAVLVNQFRTRLSKALDGIDTDAPDFTFENLMHLVGDARQETERTDLLPILREHIDQAYPNDPMKDREKLLKEIKAKVESPDLPESLAKAILSFRRARITGRSADIPQELGNLVRATRNEIQKNVDTIKERMIAFGGTKGMTRFSDDPEVNGKLHVLFAIKGELWPAEQGLVDTDTHFIDTEGNRRKIDLIFGGLSVQEIDTGCVYAQNGFGLTDLYVSSLTGVERPLFNALCDATFNVTDLGKTGTSLLTECLMAFSKIKNGAKSVDIVCPHLNKDQQRDTLHILKEAWKDVRGSGKPNQDSSEETSFVGWIEQDDGPFTEAKGFGTASIGKMVGILADFGIRLPELETPEGIAKAMSLQVLSARHNHQANDLAEWAERLTGKPARELTLQDMLELIGAMQDDKFPADPLEQLTGGAGKARNFLSGALRISEAQLDAAEATAFVKALRGLDPGSQPKELTLYGKTVRIVPTDGNLRVEIQDGNGKFQPMRASRSAAELAMQIENDMVMRLDDYGNGAVAAMLPDPALGTATVARIRELCSKVLARHFNKPIVTFASLEVADLYRAAVGALAEPPTYVEADLPSGQPTTYNDASTIELHKQLTTASQAELATVRMPAGPGVVERGVRERELPKKGTVHDLVADLLMNKDTWTFDRAGGANGDRLKRLMDYYGPEFKHLSEHPKLLDTLAEPVREPMKELALALANADPGDETRLAEIESGINLKIDAIMAGLQTTVSQLFATGQGEQVDLWKQSSAQLAGTGGLDTGTPNGRFVKSVLDRYFTQTGPIEKRAMLAAFIRNTDRASSTGKQVAELLKGAGPLLQKLLQGLPLESFGPETQEALKDMKSRLPPIPDEVVKAQMLELVRSSHGEILSIDVQKSLGAATVGQAFLCHIKTREHPVSGEDVVIKLLRPNAACAIQREYRLMAEIAGEQGESMADAFRGQYEGILQELDFTHEAENIDLGVQVYERPLGSDGNNNVFVHSMRRHGSIAPTMGALILTKADGQTVDGFITNVRQEMAEIIRPFARKLALAPDAPDVRTDLSTRKLGEMQIARFQLTELRDQAVSRRKAVAQLLDSWLTEGLVGHRFFHGDMHAGNVMTDGTNVTVIDYGNALRLSESERNGIVKMLLSAMSETPSGLLRALNDMLPESRKIPENAKASILDDLKEVLSKGTRDDASSRLLAALTVIQRRGGAVPEAVFGFVQSLTRLQGIVTGLDTTIRDLEATICEIQLDLPQLVEGKLAEFSTDFTLTVTDKVSQDVETQRTIAPLQLFDEMLRAFSGDGESGGDRQAVKAKSSLLCKIADGSTSLLLVNERTILTDEKDVRKFALLTDFANRFVIGSTPEETNDKLATLALLAERYGNLGRQSGANLRNIENEAIYGFSELKASIDAYRTALADENSSEEARAKLARQIAGNVLDGICRTAHQFRDDYFGFYRETIVDFETMVGNSVNNMFDEISLQVFDTANEAMLAIKSSPYGAPRLLTNAKAHQQHIDAVKAATARAVDKDRQRNPDVRLGDKRRRTLDGVAHDFRKPKAGIPSGADEATRTVLAEILRINAEAARAALGVERLSDAALSYFATVSDAVCDSKLTHTIRSLDDASYTALKTLLADDALGYLEKLRAA